MICIYFCYFPFVASPALFASFPSRLLLVQILGSRKRRLPTTILGVAGAASTGFSPLLLHRRGGVSRTSDALDAASDRPALRVRLVELLDGIAILFHVTIARRGRGVDAALALLETGRWCFGGVLRRGGVLVTYERAWDAGVYGRQGDRGIRGEDRDGRLDSVTEVGLEEKGEESTGMCVACILGASMEVGEQTHPIRPCACNLVNWSVRAPTAASPRCEWW